MQGVQTSAHAGAVFGKRKRGGVRRARSTVRHRRAGCRQMANGKARGETRRTYIGAIARRDGVRSRTKPSRSRPATDAWREADGEARRVHGAGRTWRRRG
ncbi:hypothetical protein WI69_03270 [Burkholderia diffusa]|nr:hypothetical protein WI69_03270 [Burkholderia diffusa]